MTTTLTRRGFMGLGVAATALAIAGCAPGGGSGSDGADSNALLASWYGGQPTTDGMTKALAAYSTAHPDTKITTTTAPFADYWDKLATQVAGGSGPDVFRMSMSYFSDYAQRGVLADLSSAVGKSIAIDTLDSDVADSGKLDGTMYGIGQSSITHATFLNHELADSVGATIPTEWDWAGFQDFVKGYAGEAGSGKYGSSDAGGNIQIFEVFARQYGTGLFDGNSLAVSQDVVEQWFAMWEGLRKAKAAPPGNVTAESSGFENSPLSKGIAPIEFGWVQQVTFYQALIDSTIKIQAVPGKTPGSLEGQFVKALDFWCVNAKSAHSADAEQLIDFLVNDQQAITALGVTLGVPPSVTARKLVAASADAPTLRAIEFVDEVIGKVGPAPGPWPKGYGDISSSFTRINENIAFGKSDPTAGAAELISEAKKVLDAQ